MLEILTFSGGSRAEQHHLAAGHCSGKEALTGQAIVIKDGSTSLDHVSDNEFTMRGLFTVWVYLFTICSV